MSVTHPVTPIEHALHKINEAIAFSAMMIRPATLLAAPRIATSLGLPQCADRIDVPCCHGTHHCTRIEDHPGLHEHLTPFEEREGLPPEYRWWRASDGTVIR